MRICRCGAIVDGACDRCDKQPAKHVQFYSSAAWRQMSLRKRKADPLCERCLDEGRTRAATEVHHIVGVDESEQLRLEWSNLMSVCRRCHDEIEGKPGVHRK